MTQSEAARSASAPGRQPPAARPGQSGPWWRVSWSVPAAQRAVRATIVIPSLFALALEVFHDPQMTLFATFGSFGALVLTSFGGTRRDKAVAYFGLAVAGSLAIIIGTLASSSAWLAAIVTVPVAFAIYFGGSAGPSAASGVTACLLAFVLPIASAGGVSTLPSRLEGWWLALAVSTASVLLLVTRPSGDQLRSQAASLATALAGLLEDDLGGGATAADREAALAAKHRLMDSFNATPYRPVGLAPADQGLANVIHLLEWCGTQIADTPPGLPPLSEAEAANRDLLAQSALALRQIGAVLSGQRADLDLEPIWRARLASARQLDRPADSAAVARRRADCAFRAESIGIAAAAAMGEAVIATRLATPGEVENQRRNWIANLPDGDADGAEPGDRRAGDVLWLGTPARTAGTILADASLRSVWFRNSIRGAIALAAAVAVAKVTNVEHAFWVVLGTISVLRTSASATGSTALRALAGTVAGFVVGAALLVGIGTTPAALWIAFPIAVLVAAYTPGTAPFVAGQAAFTVTVVVLFNLLVPAGWKVGLLRVEDVAIGCAVSLVVGFLFWPRGVSSVVGDNLADAFRSGGDYLGDAAGWALGDRRDRPERAVAAIAASGRLEDAVRAYLTEQGSKRLDKADLWALVMSATRLRLTAHSMASLPRRPKPHGDDAGLHAALRRRLSGVTDAYHRLAAEVGKPGRAGPPGGPGELPATAGPATNLRPDGAASAYWPEALWVGRHLDQLESHLGDVTGPAERLAELRRRQWWR
jgi:Fusaric acid resistance protein-like